MSADLKFSFQDNGESFLIHGHAYAALIVKIKTTWVFVVFLCWWFIVKIRTFGFTTKRCSMDNKITSVFHLKSTDLKYKWSCLYTSTNNKMSILNFTKIFFLPLFASVEMFDTTDTKFDFIEPKNFNLNSHYIPQYFTSACEPKPTKRVTTKSEQGLFVWCGISKQLCTLDKKPVITKQ